MQNNTVDYRNRKWKLDELIEYVFENHDNDAVEFLFKYHKCANINLINRIIESRNDNYFKIVLKNDDCRYLFEHCLVSIIGSETSVQKKIENLEYVIQNYPDIVDNINMVGQNLMHYICVVNDFELFSHFYHLYPELMSIHDHSVTYPIQYCYDFNEKHILDKAAEITMYYLNSEIGINPEILIKLCDHNIPEQVLKKIADYLSIDSKNISCALFNCISRVPEEIVKYFIDNGADANYRKDNGVYTVGLVARMLKNDSNIFKIFLLLEERGLIVDINVLKEACMCNNLEIVKYIRERYIIDINERIYDILVGGDLTIIQLIAYWGKFNNLYVYLLKDLDVDINVVDSNGNTILHIIYYERKFTQSRREIISALLKRGFDPYTKNNKGLYFYDYKCGGGMDDIKMLEELMLQS